MNAQAHALAAQPVDFWIRTEASLRYFLLKNRRTKRNYQPTRAMQLCLRLARQIHKGRVDIVMPDGQKLAFQGRVEGGHGVLIIHNDRVARRLLTGGRLGFCESYVDGDWTSPDIAALFETVLDNEKILMKTLNGKGWVRAIGHALHRLKPNSKKGSKKNIYRHYDIGNDFYQRWLDPGMTYSSAFYAGEEITLEAAQDKKYAEMVKRLDLKPDHHVLEIGCGWGGFAEFAAKTVGCRVTGITISQAQCDYATKRIADAGLSDLVTLKLSDYRDVEGHFDRVASIEMFEAVGEAYWPTFFNTVKSRLKPGGHAVLQIITIDEDAFDVYRRGADYIQLYIFPGGMLPSPSALNKQVEKSGLRVGDILSFGPDYAKTLAEWNQTFQEEWSNLTKAHGFDERFKRLWEQYLCYCQAGFAAGTIDVVQISIHNDGHESGHTLPH